jgi:hypothetical protein
MKDSKYIKMLRPKTFLHFTSAGQVELLEYFTDEKGLPVNNKWESYIDSQDDTNEILFCMPNPDESSMFFKHAGPYAIFCDPRNHCERVLVSLRDLVYKDEEALKRLQYLIEKCEERVKDA